VATRPNRCTLVLAIGVTFSLPAIAQFDGLFDGSPEHPSIDYADRPVRDPVAELNRKIQEGAVELKFDPSQGYLRSVLKALNVPIESQIVVFSKTSVQASRISRSNPRTLFFNDSVVIGWVHGGFMELAAQDPEQGVIFYTLDQDITGYRERAMKLPILPLFKRQNDCLACHISYATLGVPGMLVRSALPGSDDFPIRRQGDYLTDHRSPLEERWGGWYVTGQSGSVRHLGNIILTNPEAPASSISNETLQTLSGKFDTSEYLSPYSDIAALMVFDHQMRMNNLLTRVSWEARYAADEHRNDRAAHVRDAVNELVDYLLFVDEAPLRHAVEGTSGFAEMFAAQGPHDGKGRSLRQLDLKRRLMRYPCSYMIYTAAFDNLPGEVRDAIFHRMWQILSGQEAGKRYARLSSSDREAVVDILRETKHGLPAYFKSLTQ
jgi:hypothetical protein